MYEMNERGMEDIPLNFDLLGAAAPIGPMDPVVQAGQDVQPSWGMAGGSGACAANVPPAGAATLRVIVPAADSALFSIDSETDSEDIAEVSLDGQSYDLPGAYKSLDKRQSALSSAIRSRFAILSLMRKK
jgi:hypothetical protein